jgi:hypothetical protein
MLRPLRNTPHEGRRTTGLDFLVAILFKVLDTGWAVSWRVLSR